jgi:hypothetical protein
MCLYDRCKEAMAEAARQDANRRLLHSLKRKEKMTSLKRILTIWSNSCQSFNYVERKPK